MATSLCERRMAFILPYRGMTIASPVTLLIPGRDISPWVVKRLALHQENLGPAERKGSGTSAVPPPFLHQLHPRTRLIFRAQICCPPVCGLHSIRRLVR